MPRDIHRHYGPAELAEDLSGLFLGLPQLGLDLLDGRQRSLELLWELFEMLEHGDRHRSRCVPESVFGDDSILRFAENEADAGMVVRVAEKVIHSRQVKVHLPSVLGLKGAHLQIDHHEASKLQVIEKQIDLEILSSNLKSHLTSDESKSHSEFDEKLTQGRKKPLFEVALPRLRRKCEEIEVVRIFDDRSEEHTS